MELHQLYPNDLVFENEATEATGVPGTVIRQWARRGKIRRFKGRPSEYAGNGREFKTMYALPEVAAHAATYRPMPQRNPKAA
ncbi:hypothetical protein [Streptomyces sp. NRRL F-2664]|uniref:hypothetical protein n=1 Tax=Streptomyces sp. NRRL F-2664 TaxID=1463842 RepID=UPI00099853F8|nr:hypothetical protein [Streptomyces sp. NRRL F-2664]